MTVHVTRACAYEKGAQGQVTPVGGGPGAVDLMTIAGRDTIAEADVAKIPVSPRRTGSP